jgi:hypothetical protein
LTSQPIETATNEIMQSKAVLETRLGHGVESFCYPNGTRLDYNQAIMDAVRAAGFKSGLTSYCDSHVFDNVYALQRMSTGSDFDAFKRTMSGVSLLGLRFRQRSGL